MEPLINIIFKKHSDLDDKKNWIKLMQFLEYDKAKITLYIDNYLANDDTFLKEFENTYLVRLADDFAKNNALNNKDYKLNCFSCHITDMYVMKMEK